MSFIEKARDVIGAKNVLTGPDAAPYGSDWTGKYTAEPLCVLRPANTAEVSSLLALAHETETTVVPVSGNSGLSGGTHAPLAAMLSLERLNTIRDVNAAARTATVEAGVILQTLRERVAEDGLTFPVTFGAQGTARIGGILSTNAGGSNVLRYGNTRAQVLGVEVVLADGRIMDLMTALHKDNTGYDLKDLVIGAEGTLGIITAAVVKLAAMPAAFHTAMIAPTSLEAATRVLNQLQAATGGAVEAFEYMPRDYIEAHIAKLGGREPFETPQDVNVMVEVAGAPDLSEVFEEVLGAALERGDVLDATVAQSDSQRQDMWARREAAAEIAFGRSPFVMTDIALPLDKLGAFFTDIRTVLADLDPEAQDTSVAHLGDGNIHYVVYPSREDAALNDLILTAVEDTVNTFGGSFSAEHGVGLSKLPSMARQKDPVALDVMRAIKAALDPKGILNPGKVIPN
ncbi:MAG TPA: FAD-binding oxidoreductase [Maritimibacter sp.]|nr:FAD-binding oxidoreductase [Maritimibacter sp.]